MAKSKLVKVNEKIAETVVEGYQKIEDKFVDTFLNEDGSMKVGKVGDAVVDGYEKIEEGVVGGYKKIEDSVVDGFTKLTDTFVDQFLTKDGETVVEAKERLKKEEAEREERRANRR